MNQLDNLTPDDARHQNFILQNTMLQSPPHVSEIKLHLADEAHDLWHKTEEELHAIGLPPPFWAFAWAGGQGVARYILNNKSIFKNKYVLDFASGSGLVAIAACLADAKKVEANDIDVFAGPAICLNAKANNVEAVFVCSNLIGEDKGWDVVLAGDVFYDQGLAQLLIPWFDQLYKRGCLILVGDPGRSYLPKDRLKACMTYEVPVTRALEDAEVKRTTVWEWCL